MPPAPLRRREEGVYGDDAVVDGGVARRGGGRALRGLRVAPSAPTTLGGALALVAVDRVLDGLPRPGRAFEAIEDVGEPEPCLALEDQRVRGVGELDRFTAEFLGQARASGSRPGVREDTAPQDVRHDVLATGELTRMFGVRPGLLMAALGVHGLCQQRREGRQPGHLADLLEGLVPPPQLLLRRLRFARSELDGAGHLRERAGGPDRQRDLLEQTASPHDEGPCHLEVAPRRHEVGLHEHRARPALVVGARSVQDLPGASQPLLDPRGPGPHRQQDPREGFELVAVPDETVDVIAKLAGGAAGVRAGAAPARVAAENGGNCLLF
jgi:hypothetical protein